MQLEERKFISMKVLSMMVHMDKNMIYAAINLGSKMQAKI